jgi:predicted transcriptional regulator of viral defense system
VDDKRGGIRNDHHPAAVGRRLAELAGRQHGVVSRGQLHELGLDRYAVRRRVRAGGLHSLHGGRVYSVTLARLTSRGRYLAAVMAAGLRAILSHRSAAGLWALRPGGGWLEATTPVAGLSVPGITIHRTRVLAPEDHTTLDGIPVTSVARTLLDLSAVVRESDLAVAIDRAERQRIFDLDAVMDVLDRADGRRGAAALRRAIAAYRPSTQRSELERRFRDLLAAAPDIPAPFFNALVEGEATTHEVDAYWESSGLAVQLDGFEFHRTRRDRERDAASDADLELARIRVMRLTWDDTTVHGERTLRRVRLALTHG